MIQSASLPIQDIPVETIDLEEPGFDEFLFTYRPEVEGLAASIARVGMIHPVLSLRSRERARLRLISGYGRVLACRKIGQKSVGARVLPGEEVTREEAFLLSLHENIHSRGLHDLEKALALKKFKLILEWPEEKIVSDLAPLLDLASSPEMVRTYLSLNGLIEEIRSSFYEGRITRGQAFLLADLPEPEQGVLSRLVLKRCLLNQNELKEVIRNLSDLRDRRKTSFEEILHDPSLPPSFRSEEAGERERGQALRLGLRCLRYPRLSHKEKAFEEAAGEIHLGSEVLFRPAPFFESNDLRLQVTVKSADQLREMLRKMEASLDDGRMEQVFRIIRE